jgi:uroporphyrin-III C-methyltransferase
MSRPEPSRSLGRVDLVGAGPGLGDLITVRGLNLLKTAEVVIYDRLIDHALLTHCPADAELIYVGKSPNYPAKSQPQINNLIIEHAQRGSHVLRLKGGDPMIFGRAGEEISACNAAGIPVNIVPGVSSALAVAGAAGIPLTERGLSRSIGIITGHVHGDEGAAPVRLHRSGQTRHAGCPDGTQSPPANHRSLDRSRSIGRYTGGQHRQRSDAAAACGPGTARPACQSR